MQALSLYSGGCDGMALASGWVETDIPNRAARIKMIGNACPPQRYLVWLAGIVEVEKCLPI